MQKKKLAAVGVYDVGYGKPPEATQFEKGKSGNPKGRPKGSKNKNPLVKLDQFNQLFSQSMQAVVSPNDETEVAPKTVYLTLLEILKERAFGGDLRALQFLIKTSHQIDHTERLKNEKIVEKMHEYKVITTMVIKEREYKGYSIDHILPHPDHVHIDLKTAEVYLRGPGNKKEKQLWDIGHAAIRDLVASIKLNAQKYLYSESEKEKTEALDLISTDLDYLKQIQDFFEGWDVVIPWDEVKKSLKEINYQENN
jgi:hypothetical protein